LTTLHCNIGRRCKLWTAFADAPSFHRLLCTNSSY